MAAGVEHQGAIRHLAVAASGKAVQLGFFPTTAGMGQLKYRAVITSRRISLGRTVKIASSIHGELGPWSGLATTRKIVKRT